MPLTVSFVPAISLPSGCPGRGIQRHVDLLDDDLALFLDFRGVEFRMEKNIRQDIEGVFQVRLGDFAPVDREFFVRAGIKHAADALHDGGYLRGGGVFICALETHVLDEM